MGGQLPVVATVVKYAQLSRPEICAAAAPATAKTLVYSVQPGAPHRSPPAPATANVIAPAPTAPTASAPQPFPVTPLVRPPTSIPSTRVGSHPLPTPPVTGAMELNEWTHSILRAVYSSPRVIKPGVRLSLYLENSGGAAAARACNGSRRSGAVGAPRYPPPGSDAHARAHTTAHLHPPRHLHYPVIHELTDWKAVVMPLLNRAFARLADHWRQPRLVAEGSLMVMGGGEMRVRPRAVPPVSAPPPFPTNGLGRPQQQQQQPLYDPSRPLRPEAMAAALLALYYHSLEALLFDETARLKSASHPKIVLSTPFHSALLAVCYLCLLKATGGVSGSCVGENNGDASGDGDGGDSGNPSGGGARGLLDVHSIFQITECTAYDFLKVSESFVRSSSAVRRPGSGNGGGGGGGGHGWAVSPLPAALRRHVRETEEMVLDSMLWKTEASNGGISVAGGASGGNPNPNGGGGSWSSSGPRGRTNAPQAAVRGGLPGVIRGIMDARLGLSTAGGQQLTPPLRHPPAAAPPSWLCPLLALFPPPRGLVLSMSGRTSVAWDTEPTRITDVHPLSVLQTLINLLGHSGLMIAEFDIFIPIQSKIAVLPRVSSQ